MLNLQSRQAVAKIRFGLGGRPDDDIGPDPRAWLEHQLTGFDPRPASIARVPDFAAASARIGALRDEQRLARARGDDTSPNPNVTAPPTRAMAMQGSADVRDMRTAHVAARAAVAVASDTPFVERLVHFWSNHFAVSTGRLELVSGAGPFEFEAIRPNVLGRFSDLVHAVETHPVMLIYLDQASSVGPDSAFARKKRPGAGIGLNENLAREVLELHTMGVRSGYSQADVTELARALTGWTVAGAGAGGKLAQPFGTSVFMPEIHEPGDRVLLGRRVPAGGREQVEAIFAEISNRPETAHHIATKLAIHFVSDTPPPALVARLEQAFRESQGHLPTVYRALIDAPEAWTLPFTKFKSPWDWLISSWRALPPNAVLTDTALLASSRLGQPVWQPGSPAGWPDGNRSWAGPDELMRRMNAAVEMIKQAGPDNTTSVADVAALANRLLSGVLGDRTARMIAGADHSGQALELLLLSPEFQWR
jgi:uncharacterized protein (DUF1800 family)